MNLKTKLAIAFIALGSTTLHAEGVLALAVSGDPAPDRDGVLEAISIFSLKEGAAAYSVLTTGNTGGTAHDFILATVTKHGTDVVFREGDHSTANGTFAFSSGQISVNSHGRVAFIGGLSNTAAGAYDDEGIFSGDGGSITEIARENQPEPMGGAGVFNSFTPPSINTSGQVVFWGAVRNTGTPLFSTHGIFIGNGGALKQVARTYTASQDGNGEFSILSSSPVISDSGNVAFRADLRKTTGGADDNSGIFVGNGTSLTTIARENDLSPDGNGRLNDINYPFINSNNKVAFYTNLRNTSGGSTDNVAIFRGSGSSLTKIARTGDSAPDSLGSYTYLTNTLSINSAGDVVFTAGLSGGKQAVVWSNGTTTKVIARSGDTGPNTTNYTFAGFTLAAINDTRTVAFQADLSYGSEQRGIYLSDGEDTLLIAKTGDQLNGSTIKSLGFDPKTFNNFEELAFQAVLTNGKCGVFLFSPKLKWRHNENGSWDNASGWTASLRPSGYAEVEIDPKAGAIVTGPTTDTEIRDLSLGATSTGTSELNLQPSGALTVLEGAAIGGNGKLTGNGLIIGDVTNQGVVSPGNSPGSITVSGNYTQMSKGVLHLELGGRSTDVYDQLIATGNVQLAGTLQIVLLNDFVPSAGDSFTLVSAGGALSGKITKLVVPDVPNITWQVKQTGTILTLKAVATALVQFRSRYGLNSDGSDDNASWSGNGVPNVLYFLMDLGDPNQANIRTAQVDGFYRAVNAGLPLFQADGSNGWAFSFMQSKNATGYDYIVEVSDDLSTWTGVYDVNARYKPTGFSISSFDDDYNTCTLFFSPRTEPTFFRVRLHDTSEN